MNLVAGSMRILRIFGIDVFLHWSWIIVAVLMINLRRDLYSSPFWNIAEYVTLFIIVLLHEFGHALACRSVGGEADQVVLWPMGGVAFVSPPRRPGPVLWSIVAGPLVNVLLLLPLFWLEKLAKESGLKDTQPDLAAYIHGVALINLLLLIFNMLPVYPLDGGKIVQALLWFILGEARSLWVACALGVVGSMGLGLLGFMNDDKWLMFIAAYMAYRSILGFQTAGALSKLARMPRRPDYACPACGEHPIVGACWQCDECGQAFDKFETDASCPNCHERHQETVCIWCRKHNAFENWKTEGA